MTIGLAVAVVGGSGGRGGGAGGGSGGGGAGAARTDTLEAVAAFAALESASEGLEAEDAQTMIPTTAAAEPPKAIHKGIFDRRPNGESPMSIDGILGRTAGGANAAG